MNYVVEVVEPPQGDRSAVVAHIAASFGIAEAKAARLLARAPGPVTKPVSKAEADAVAKIFRGAGLRVEVRTVEGSERSTSAAPTAVNANPFDTSPGIPAPDVPQPEPAAPEPTRPDAPPAAAGSTRPAVDGAGRDGAVVDDDEGVLEVDDAATDADRAEPTHDLPPAKDGVDRFGAEGSVPVERHDTGATRASGGDPATSAAGSAAGSTTGSTAGFAAGSAAGSAAESGAESEGAVAREVAEHEKTLSEASFAPPVAAAPSSGRSGGSLRRKILTAGVAPALLTITFALGAVVLTLGPTLRTQLLEAARNPAIAFASAIEGLLGERELASEEVRDALQTAVQRARADFEAQSIEFVLVTDTAGNRLAGWPAPDAIPTVLLPAIQSQALGAQARAYGSDNGIEFGERNPPSRRVTIGGSSVEVASSAIRGSDASVGAVVVGITNASLNQRIRAVLLTAAGAGLIPVLVALIAALALTRALTRNIYYLIDSADRISRGDLADEVELESNDELSDLATAIERMRLSLQEAIERLRRRRRP